MSEKHIAKKSRGTSRPEYWTATRDDLAPLTDSTTFDRATAAEIIGKALAYFVAEPGAPLPHMKEAKADALLQKLIKNQAGTESGVTA